MMAMDPAALSSVATQIMVDELTFAKAYIENQIQAGTSYDGLAASQARAFKGKIKAMRKLDHAGGIKIAEAINASLFTDEAKQELHTCVSAKVCTQQFRPSDVMQWIDLEGYLTKDEWNRMVDATATVLNVAAMCSFRLKSLGVFNPTEPCYGRIAGIIALVCDKEEGTPSAVRMHEIYNTIKRVHGKNCAKAKRVDGMPFISKYPMDPHSEDLPDGFITMVYKGANDDTGPVEPIAGFRAHLDTATSQTFMRRPRGSQAFSFAETSVQPFGRGGDMPPNNVQQFMGFFQTMMNQMNTRGQAEPGINLQFPNAGQQQRRAAPSQFQLHDGNPGSSNDHEINKRLQLFREQPASSPEAAAMRIAMGGPAVCESPTENGDGADDGPWPAADEEENYKDDKDDDDDDGAHAGIASKQDPLAEMRAMAAGMATANALAIPSKKAGKATSAGTCSQYGHSG